MAVTSIWPIKGRLDVILKYASNPEKTVESNYINQSELHSVDNVIEYAADEMKTEKRMYVSGIGCNEYSMDNSITNMKPHLVKEWSERNLPLSPDEVPYGSNKLYWWKGSCGHEWEASAKARSVGEKCPICSGARVVAGINDLKTICPSLAEEWSTKNKIEPTQVSVGSHKKVLWHGKCGHEWTAVIKNRVRGAGCPYCSHNIVLPGFNDLASRFPNLAAEWSERNYPLRPDQVNEKSTKNVWWKCRVCGNEWKAVINARVKGVSCPVCAERKVLKGYNDLATTDAVLCKEWDYEKNKVEPTEISRNSHNRAWWLCKYGHSWNAKICERTHESKTCTVCESEFDSLLVQLLVSLYAKQYNMRVATFDDNIIGLPLETYIPDMLSAIEYVNKKADNERAVKEHLCKMNGISYFEVSSNNRLELADKIKRIFREKNIYILSNSQEDIEQCKKAFLRWKDKTQQ